VYVYHLTFILLYFYSSIQLYGVNKLGVSVKEGDPGVGSHTPMFEILKNTLLTHVTTVCELSCRRAELMMMILFVWQPIGWISLQTMQ